MFRFIATTPDTMSGANIPRNLRLLSSILRRLRVIFLSYFLHCWCVINFHLKSIFNLKHSDSCSWLSSWDSRKKKKKNAIVALQVYLVSRLFLLMQRNASMDVFSLMFLRVCFCCLHMKVFYFCGTACYSLKKKKYACTQPWSQSQAAFREAASCCRNIATSIIYHSESIFTY